VRYATIMNQRTRDIIGTFIVFCVLLLGTSMVILMERFLDNFKAH